MVVHKYQEFDFDLKKPFIVLKPMNVGGRKLKYGDPYPYKKYQVSKYRLAQLFDGRFIGHPPADQIETVQELIDLELAEDGQTIGYDRKEQDTIDTPSTAKTHRRGIFKVDETVNDVLVSDDTDPDKVLSEDDEKILDELFKGDPA